MNDDADRVYNRVTALVGENGFIIALACGHWCSAAENWKTVIRYDPPTPYEGLCRKCQRLVPVMAIARVPGGWSPLARMEQYRDRSSADWDD